MSVEGPTAPGMEAQPTALIGQILDGRYRITRKLGEGGMGEVYAAEHVHIEKRFAIKLLRQEIVSNAEAVTRFRQEARSSSSIGHRNIIAIEDFGQLSDGRIYMCMELLNGAPLNDLITQPMAVDRLLNILIQTGHGLAAAHAKGIIHRDMKPENIFVTIGQSGEDVPKILDFGIAKVSGNDGQNHLTRTGTIFGTPFYMAPEQALGNPVDERTDIYAVGVIMYECFAGSLPFQGDSFMGILTQHITMEPEPVVQRAARAGRPLPPGLADVITRCMQKNPAQRFSKMDELVNVLIQIYRGIVGPGMSTYMEAFPVMPSAMHQVQSTPSPMTGPVMIGPPSAPTVGVGPSGSAPVVSAASSGVYRPGVPGTGPYATPPGQTQKSKLGLIIAILAVIFVGGGVAAFAIISKGGGGGSGSGSQLAGGHSRTGQEGSSGSGSETISHHGSNETGSETPRVDGSGSARIAVGSDDGSAKSGTEIGSGRGTDAGSNVPPPLAVVQVRLSTKSVRAFEVWENGTKLMDGPGTIEVPLGGSRPVVIKAKGFHDHPLDVPGLNRPFLFGLDRVVNAGSGSGHGSQVPPIPTANCRNAIVDPKSTACVQQYCNAHPDDNKCQLE